MKKSLVTDIFRLLQFLKLWHQIMMILRLFRWHDWKSLLNKSNAIFLDQLSIIGIILKKLLLNFIGLVKHLPEANSWIANNSEHLGLLFFIPHWALLRFLPISYKSSHKLLHWLGRPPTSMWGSRYNPMTLTFETGKVVLDNTSFDV